LTGFEDSKGDMQPTYVLRRKR